MALEKNVISKHYDLNTHGVSQSLLGKYKNCRVACAFYLNKWEKPGISEPLLFGDAFHDMLENFYNFFRSAELPKPCNKKGFPKSHNLAEEAVKVAPMFIEAWVKKHRAEIMEPRGSQFIEYIEEIMPKMLSAYILQWPEDFYSARKWVGLESQFNVEFEGFNLVGKRDGLYRHKGLWLLETKTAGQISEHEMNDKLCFDFQNLFYLTATVIETKQKINGVLYNVIRRPGLKQGKAESYPAFMERIYKDVTVKREHYFKRFPVSYSHKRQQAFLTELEATLFEFQDWLEGDVHTYKNEAACIGRGSCNYLAACAQGSTAGYQKRKQMFPELEVF